MLGVMLDRESFDRNDLDLGALRASLDHWQEYAHTTPAQCAERIAEAEVIITNKVVLDRSRLAQAPKLKLICIAATGTNNVDLKAAAELGIPVCNVTGYATPAVVQYVFAALTQLWGRYENYRKAVAQGEWSHSRHFCLLDTPFHELAGRTLGIVGLGELGRGVAQVAEAFGMRVQVAARPGSGAIPPGRLSLDELLPQCDVLSLHCPLTPETEGLIGAQELALLPPHALLINSARGGIVDEPALADALRMGRLGGAAVDCLTQEPPPVDHPLLAGDIPNLILTPHIAWASIEARQRLVDGVTEHIHAFCQGQPLNSV